MDKINYGDGKPKAAGTWDFYGAYMPGNSMIIGYDTFTLGIFQWVEKKTPINEFSYEKVGHWTKRGKVVKRVRESTCNVQKAIDRATKICDEKNGGVK